jgi:hypothetical protein
MKKIFKSTVILIVFSVFIGCDFSETVANNQSILLTIVAKNSDATPAIGAHIMVNYTSESSNVIVVDFGYTDNNGKAIATIPSNQNVIMKAYDNSDLLIFQQNIPAFHDAESTFYTIIPSVN